MFYPNKILPFHIVKRTVECDALDEMSDEMRDLLQKSCAAYGITIPEQAQRQKTDTEGKAESSRSHLLDPKPIPPKPKHARPVEELPTQQDPPEDDVPEDPDYSAWPTELCTYGPSHEQRDSDNITILRTQYTGACLPLFHCIDYEESLLPFRVDTRGF